MKPLSRGELRAGLVARRAEDHKGTFGHVLIAAGSRGMSGAAVLAARAALRSGAGLVTAAVPESVQAIVAAAAPEALTLGLPEDGEAVGALQKAHAARRYDVLAIGPGLSTREGVARLVVDALDSLALPAVVDADALNALASSERARARDLLRRRKAPTVFTPHPGELARCLAVSAAQVLEDRAGCAARLAREWNGVVLLKGHETVIVGQGRSAVNKTGGPGLAKGGTGDVLTGLIAGLWAQALASGRAEAARDGFLPAALGAWLHGAAGDAAARAKTPWAMTAQDVVDFLPAAFRRLA